VEVICSALHSLTPFQRWTFVQRVVTDKFTIGQRANLLLVAALVDSWPLRLEFPSSAYVLQAQLGTIVIATTRLASSEGS
jgi:hypothetical protein